MARFTDKVAVVTGASKGIGAGIAKRLAAEGATVVVNYSSSKEGADRVVAEITQAGGKAVAIGASVADEAGVQALFDAVKTQFGRVDVLVNNAGVYKMAPFDALTVAEFHRQFDTNVLGLLLATKAAAPLIPEGGAVVNISSVVSSAAPPNGSIYNGTKGAVDAITKTLAKELGAKKIRVNSVNPGMVATEGTQSAGFTDGDFAKVVLSMTPLGRLGEPADIAAVVAFFASDDASWITGETLVVAGGFGM